jgi:hypothetical protein
MVRADVLVVVQVRQAGHARQGVMVDGWHWYCRQGVLESKI